MSSIKDQAEIAEMRRRLYERGNTFRSTPHYTLTDNPVPIKETWQSDIPSPVDTNVAAVIDLDPRPTTLTEAKLSIVSSKPIKKHWAHHYRSIVLLGTLVVFLCVLGGTSLYLLLGSNQISNKNIEVVLTGPLTIGGGEVMPLQVAVTNQNKVPIESVILVMNYPAGTKAADNSTKDLFEDRIPLNSVKAGETLTIPVKAIMYGEENQTGQIKATIEYHLIDSNGTFYKDASPLDFKITSSPLVIHVDAVNKISSGQEVTINLTLQSNSSAPLKGVLLTANYPSDFSFTSADPAPSYRDSSWIIKDIEPGQAAKISLKGLIVGDQSEQFQLQFTAGTPQQDNQYIIGSPLATATTDFTVEQPFIGVTLATNNTTGDVVVLKTGQPTAINVKVQNTLTDTLYNMSVEIDITGNVIMKDKVEVSNGFYDSIKNAVIFQVSGDPSLAQVAPGETKDFNFSIIPSSQTETPAFALVANAYARRVSDAKASEQLVGTAKQEARYSSSLSLFDKVNHANGIFTDSGPIPPMADSKTTYTVTLNASAGGNNTADVVVRTSLPQYVTWENNTTGDGTIAFNPINNEITWTVGNVDANQTKESSFQISLIPSQNQIGSTPSLVGSAQLRGTDLFTTSVIRAETASLNTELSSQSGYGNDNGRVVRAPSSIVATTTPI